MNEQFSEVFGDTLPEGFGEDPSRVIQPIGQAAPLRGGPLDAYDQDVRDNPGHVGPTNTPMESPVVERYRDNPAADKISALERQIFLQNYAGLSGLALDNASDPGYHDVGPDKEGYTYRWYADNTYKVLSGPKNVGKTYTDTKGVLTATFGPYSSLSSSSSSSSSSTKKKGMSKKSATALGAGIGAGIGELAKSFASMLGPQTATPLSQEELTGTTTTETSSGLPWGWILGGAGVLLVGGVLIFAVSRGGRGSSEE